MTYFKMLLAVASVSLIAAGCVGAYEPIGNGGDDDSTGNPGDGPDAAPGVTPPGSPDAAPGGTPTANAKPMFDSTVAPILQATCSAAGCHGGTGTSPLKFLPPSMADYYSVVTSYDDRVIGYFDKTTAPMLNRIVPGPHNGASYTPAQVQAIKDWLDAELTARAAPVPPGTPDAGAPAQTPGQVSRQLIAEWSGCMDQASWDQAQVAQKWARKQTNQGQCVTCHVNGQGGFLATEDSTRMFSVYSTNKYYLLAFFTPNVTDPAAAKMEINRDMFVRVGTNVFPYQEHPQFNVDDGGAMQALQSFYDATLAKKAAGTCGPPRITP